MVGKQASAARPRKLIDFHVNRSCGVPAMVDAIAIVLQHPPDSGYHHGQQSKRVVLSFFFASSVGSLTPQGFAKNIHEITVSPYCLMSHGARWVVQHVSELLSSLEWQQGQYLSVRKQA
jgi:hypothetical protein